jgi:exoribonuclease II
MQIAVYILNLGRSMQCQTAVLLLSLATQCGVWGAVQREANQLVEECMLLANMSVAKIVADAFPERALLRRHPPPDERKIGDLVQMAEDLVSSPDPIT